MDTAPKSKSAFMVANIIKFGLPLGLILAFGRLFYFYFFSTEGVNADILGTSVGILVFGLFFGTVLGFVRLRKINK